MINEKTLKAKLQKSEIAKLARTAYTVSPKKGDSASSVSKTGGTARLLPDETWPACHSCKEPMPLFLQLDMAVVPEKAAPELVQIFHCTHCAEFETGGASAEDTHLVRSLDAAAVRSSRAQTPPEFKSPIKPKLLVGWKEIADYPDVMEDLGIDIQSVSQQCGLGEEDYHSLACSREDKLFGWPRWTQGAEYPSCPDCATSMTEMLFQFRSESLVNWLWGDGGWSYVFRCPKHRNRLAVAFNG